MRRVFLFLLFFSTFCMFSINWGWLSPFLTSSPNYLFLKNQLFDVTSIAKLEIDGGKDWIVAQGDFFNNRKIELVVVGCEGKCFYFRCWDHSDWYFKHCSIPKLYIENKNNVIYGVQIGDFSMNGFLDVLVFEKNPQFPEENYNLTIFLNNDGKSFTRYEMEESLSSQVELIILDYNGDLRIDLFGMRDDKRGFWVNKYSNGPMGFEFEFVEQKYHNDTFLHPLISPHTSSFVDIDGDCVADLFIMSGYDTSEPFFEIWLNRNGNFQLTNKLSAPLYSNRVTWSDIDRDGNLDMIFYICKGMNCEEKSEIVVWYNNQERMCKTKYSKKNGRKCRSSKNLCSSSEKFTFGTEMQTVLDLKLTNLRLLKNSHGIYQIVAADYDLDGYPDLFVITVDNEGKKSLNVLKNVPCTKGSCTQHQITNGLRTFEFLDVGIDDIQKIDNPDYVFIYDLDGMGHLDVVVVSYDQIHKNRNVSIFYNNFYNDAFFVKSYSLNGVDSKKGFNYGAFVPGSLIKFTISDNKGNLQPHVSTMYPSSTHLTVPVTYELSGTGRTSDYIQHFYYSFPISNRDKSYSKELGLIPNSQIICIPHLGEKKKIKFEIVLFVIPQRHALFVTLSLIGSLVVLGIPILLCYTYEMIIDRREKRRKTSLKGVYIG